MPSIYHRANPSQARIMRAVEGAVRNAADAHPGWSFDRRFARSVAKRAAGTLTAEWPDVLAARLARRQAKRASGLAEGAASGEGVLRLSRHSLRGGFRVTRAAPLKHLWRQLSRMAGEAKHQPERQKVIVEVLRMVSELQRNGR